MHKQPGIALAKDPLQTPLTIKSVTFRNRIISTSHACGLELNGMPAEAYQLYHQEKAKGGLALSMFGGSSNVAKDSPNVFRQLNVGTDEIIPYLIEFSERMHREGAALMCQITHLGRRGDANIGDRLPTIGPSVIRETLHRNIPREMDENDIQRVVASYADAARRCRDGGLDGIETMAASHLIGQFLSPATNRRTDKYGGSLENRARFGLMVHEAIRKAVGDKFIVGLRLSIDENEEQGMAAEDCIAAALLFKNHGSVDFFNAIYGTMDTYRALSEDNMPGMGTPIAPFVEAVGAFKREVGLPVFHATRISDLASARYAVSTGKLDLVGMTRAQIADPHLVRKMIEGRETEIRPCVGATHCQSPAKPACLHNASTGREKYLPYRIPKIDGKRKSVVVIGGGPAGLEAARISAERGHDVTIHEAAPDFGGQVRLGARGWRKDLLSIVDWRVSELERLGVRMHLNSYVEAQDLLEHQADVIIVATGGMPLIEVGGMEFCTSAWDVIAKQVKPTGNCLVYDGTGRHPALLSLAESLDAGAKPLFVSIDQQIGEELTYAERLYWRKRLAHQPVDYKFGKRLVSLSKSNFAISAVLVDEITREVETVFVDMVISDQGSTPNDELFKALRDGSDNQGFIDIDAFAAGAAQPEPAGQGYCLYMIGDAAASRNIYAAVLDAARICTTL